MALRYIGANHLQDTLRIPGVVDPQDLAILRQALNPDQGQISREV